jgi:hypothetical protein
MLWGNTKYDYLEAAMGYSSDLSKSSYLNLGWSQPGLVTYMESHDEERMMYKNITYGAVSVPPGYDVKDFKTALKRVKLAGVFFFTIPGPKMIWQFEEVGYDIRRGEGDEKLEEKPIKWDYYTNSDRRNVYDNFKALIDLRKKYETFSSNDFTIYQTGKLKRLNVVHPEMDVVAVGNFDVAAGSINSNFTRTGKWYEFFSGDSVDINTSNQNLSLNLIPGEYRLYTSKKISRPSFLLSIDDNVSGEISGELLFDIYPNPFSEEMRIKFTGENEYQPHTVEIFSADGARVRIISCPAGISEVPLDGADFAGGIYYVRVTSGRLHSVKKIVRF